jgi:hypothetical protein
MGDDQSLEGRTGVFRHLDSRTGAAHIRGVSELALSGVIPLTSETVDYPVQFDISRDATQSRLTNFPLGIGFFIRSILLIPHFIILYFLGIVAYIVYFIAKFAILFTGRYPEGMYSFVLTYVRWNARNNAYLLSLFDKYPPFHGNEDPATSLSFTTVYPATSSRLLNFPFLGLIIRAILLIPHFIVVAFLAIAMVVVVFVAQFAILFSGAFPEGMHAFCVGVSRWSNRLTAYMFGLTDAYPPFSLK